MLETEENAIHQMWHWRVEQDILKPRNIWSCKNLGEAGYDLASSTFRGSVGPATALFWSFDFWTSEKRNTHGFKSP